MAQHGNDVGGHPAQNVRVLFCGCAHYDIIPKESRQDVLGYLRKAGVQVAETDDLCGLTARRDPILQRWIESESPVVIACFPRAVRWLFYSAGLPLDDRPVRFLNMRTQTPEEIVRELTTNNGSPRTLEDVGSSTQVNHQSSIIDNQSDWVPWFPVIDYDRCRNCKQCLNFCLFGVYELSQSGRVEVRKPQACKTNCPACARMCPEKAIIFPKYSESPINGDMIPEGKKSPQTGTSELQSLLKGDLYKGLRARDPHHKRFSSQPKESLSNRSCPNLEALRKELGIPHEVLASLSPRDLQELGKQSETSRDQQSVTTRPKEPSDSGKTDHE